jgi:hypothetical protein
VKQWNPAFLVNLKTYQKEYGEEEACERACRGTDKSLARPGKKQARKHVRDARDFNKIETRAFNKLFFFFFFFLLGKALKEIYGILTDTLACFLVVGLRTY